jgi:hypothetical protein
MAAGATLTFVPLAMIAFLGRRFSNLTIQPFAEFWLVAIQPNHTLATGGVYGVIATQSIWDCSSTRLGGV